MVVAFYTVWNGTGLCLMKVSLRSLPYLYILAQDLTSSSHTELYFEAMESGSQAPDKTEMVSIRDADSEQAGRPCLTRGISPASSPLLQRPFRQIHLETAFGARHKFQGT